MGLKEGFLNKINPKVKFIKKFSLWSLLISLLSFVSLAFLESFQPEIE